MRAELVLWVVAAALVAGELHVVFHGPERAERVLKPLSVASIGVAAVGSGLLQRPWGIVALLALALGLVGDVLLLDGERPSRFMGGLGAFLGGHLLYLAAFVVVGLSVNPWLALPAAVSLVCLLVSRALLPSLWRAGDRPLAGAVATYMVVLTVAAVCAGATGRPLVAVGAALFVLSDTILAMDKFLAPVPRAHLWVMATYLLAQTGIVAGLALR
jgi:uncharacterized membrane protein YhhN